MVGASLASFLATLTRCMESGLRYIRRYLKIIGIDLSVS